MTRSTFRSPLVLWRISAATALGAAVLAVTRGFGATAAVLALWAVVSLSASVDHVVEPALAELLDTVADERAAPHPTAPIPQRPVLSSRQDRVLRLLAYGLPDDEIAEVLDLDAATVRSDVAGILVHLGAKDRAQAMDVAHDRSVLTAARRSRPAA